MSLFYFENDQDNIAFLLERAEQARGPRRMELKEIALLAASDAGIGTDHYLIDKIKAIKPHKRKRGKRGRKRRDGQ